MSAPPARLQHGQHPGHVMSVLDRAMNRGIALVLV
jgi:hypothetical protein